MDIFLSIITFPLFFSLWLYVKLLDIIIQPSYIKGMNLIVKLNPHPKYLLPLASFFVYLESTKLVSYQILVGNKDLWWIWIEFFGNIL